MVERKEVSKESFIEEYYKFIFLLFYYYVLFENDLVVEQFNSKWLNMVIFFFNIIDFVVV